jgi:hypothetical protein
MYLTGGATAVLEGWRESTVDVDIRFEPDSDAALERIRDLKEELSLNVKLASPLDFLPPLPGWEERSRFRRSWPSSSRQSGQPAVRGRVAWCRLNGRQHSGQLVPRAD